MDGADVKYDGLREAAASPSAADLDAARFGFDRTHPHRSAKRTFFFTQLLIFALLLGGGVFAAIRAPGPTFSTLYVVTFTLFAMAIAVRLVAAASLTRVMWRLADQADVPTYTILCPLYREANVVPDLVAALERIDYPGT